VAIGFIKSAPNADTGLLLRYASTMQSLSIRMSLLALSLLAPPAGRAQQPTTTAVTIRVTDPMGVPIAHAQIGAVVGATIAQVETDLRGQYTHDLRSGAYVWSVSARGFLQHVAIIDLPTILSPGGTKFVSVVLQPWLAPADANGSLVPTAQVEMRGPTPIQAPDEYEVWSAVLTKKYGDGIFQRLVVRDRTEMLMHEPIANRWQNSEQDTEAFADLKVKNKTRYALENKFSLKLPCILISSGEENKVFKSVPVSRADKDFAEKAHSSWQRFYEEYPGAQGILTISRVGFDSDKSHAVVYIANTASLMLASGKLFFLAKKNGSWEIQTEQMIWFS
jgi:hypothetical protein